MQVPPPCMAPHADYSTKIWQDFIFMKTLCSSKNIVVNVAIESEKSVTTVQQYRYEVTHVITERGVQHE